MADLSSEMLHRLSGSVAVARDLMCRVESVYLQGAGIGDHVVTLIDDATGTLSLLAASLEQKLRET
jgi:hypothetical protein